MQRTSILARNTKLSEFDDIRPMVVDHLSKVKPLRTKKSNKNSKSLNITLFNFL